MSPSFSGYPHESLSAMGSSGEKDASFGLGYSILPLRRSEPVGDRDGHRFGLVLGGLTIWKKSRRYYSAKRKQSFNRQGGT